MDALANRGLLSAQNLEETRWNQVRLIVHQTRPRPSMRIPSATRFLRCFKDKALAHAKLMGGNLLLANNVNDLGWHASGTPQSPDRPLQQLWRIQHHTASHSTPASLP